MSWLSMQNPHHSFWGLESMENGKHLGKIGVAIQEAS